MLSRLNHEHLRELFQAAYKKIEFSPAEQAFLLTKNKEEAPMKFASRIVNESLEVPPESSQEAAHLPRSPRRLKLKQDPDKGA